MNIDDLYRNDFLVGTVVAISDGAEECEFNMDSGMLACIKAITSDGDKEGACLEITLDVNDFVAYNKDKAQPNFWDENGNPTLKWHETRFYPKDGLEKVFISEQLLNRAFIIPDPKEVDMARKMKDENIIADIDFLAVSANLEKARSLALQIHDGKIEDGVTPIKALLYLRTNVADILHCLEGKQRNKKTK